MDILIEISNTISAIIEPFFNQFLGFIDDGYYILYAVVALFLVILILVGLFTFLKRAPKFFLFIVVLLGAVGALWYFLVLPATL